MENDILDGLQNLGYDGELLREGGLEKALNAGVKSAEYREAVVWLTGHLKTLCNLDEEVHEIDSPDDTNMFMLELSGFLKDIGCQYKFLTEGYASERLQTHESRLMLLHYLLTELQAAKMVAVNQVKKPKMEVTLNETPTAGELKNMLMALKFPKPPDNISPEMLFGKAEQRLKEVINSAPPQSVGKPLFIGVLTDQQWHTLAEVNKELRQEYQIRREMLIKRLDVTVQSFQWSDRVKDKENLIASVMVAKRAVLDRTPAVRLSDLLAAREDLAIIEKTSNANVRKNTQSKLNKLIIGQEEDGLEAVEGADVEVKEAVEEEEVVAEEVVAAAEVIATGCKVVGTKEIVVIETTGVTAVTGVVVEGITEEIVEVIIKIEGVKIVEVITKIGGAKIVEVITKIEGVKIVEVITKIGGVKIVEVITKIEGVKIVEVPTKIEETTTKIEVIIKEEVVGADEVVEEGTTNKIVTIFCFFYALINFFFLYVLDTHCTGNNCAIPNFVKI